MYLDRTVLQYIRVSNVQFLKYWEHCHFYAALNQLSQKFNFQQEVHTMTLWTARFKCSI